MKNIFLIFSSFLVLLLSPVSLAATVYDLRPKYEQSTQLNNQPPFTLTSFQKNGLSGLTIQLSLTTLTVEPSPQQFEEFFPNNSKKFYSLQDINGLNLTQNPGYPSVPFISLLVEGRPEDFQVETDLGRAFILKNFSPAPALKKPCRCDKNENQLNENKIVTKAYEDNDPKEQKIFKWEYLGDFRGTPLSRLLIFPRKFQGENSTFTIYPNLKLNIVTIQEKKLTFYAGAEQFLGRRTQEQSLPRKMLILSPEKWLTQLQPLVDWKRKIGIEVQVVSLADAGHTFDEIRSFLRERYLKPSTTFTYAILVGHEEILPTQYVPTSSNPETPSDMNYFLMGDTEDQIPDVFYGRFVVDEDKDLTMQIQKIIEYEKAAFASSHGLSKGVGIASNEGYNPSDVEYLLDIQKPFQENQKTEFKNFLQINPDAHPQNINEAISQGVMWISYIGHGSGFAWSSLHSSDYTSQEVQNLLPAAVRPIIIDVSCQNGRFLYDGHLGERFMNESIDQKPLGTTAYYGGSVDISWDPPAIMARGISHSYFEQKLNFLGETLLSGQMYLYSHYSVKESIRENFVWYHLLGDPSLLLRTGPVKNLHVSIENSILYLTDEERAPLPFQEINFWGPGGEVLSRKTDHEGKVLLHSFQQDHHFSHFSILIKGFRYHEGIIP